MREMKTTGEEVSGTLGGRLFALRRDRGMTLEGLSGASGVSRAMISKVERDEKSPTVSVAARLASGLGVSVGRLLGEEGERRVTVLKRRDQMLARDPVSGFERRSLSGSGGLEFIRNALPEGALTGQFPSSRAGSTEYIGVECGELRAMVGEEEYTLEAGDALTFEADAPHRFENIGCGVAIYYSARTSTRP